MKKILSIIFLFSSLLSFGQAATVQELRSHTFKMKPFSIKGSTKPTNLKEISLDSLLKATDNQISVAGLRTLSGFTPFKSYLITDSGKEGVFKYDETDVTTADNLGTVIVDATGRRWKRVYENTISIKWFGAVANGTNTATAIQNAVNEAQFKNKSLLIDGNANEYIITSAIQITAPITILGEGNRVSRITANGCDGFVVAAGTNYVKMAEFRVSSLTRYNDSVPNSLIGIKINGTTSSQCYWHKYQNIFIDGFLTGIQANAIWSSNFEGIDVSYSKNGIISFELSANNFVTNCKFTGIYSGNSIGVQIGDGTNQSEGWIISNNLIFGFAKGIYAYGSLNCFVTNNILDHVQDVGIFLRTSATSPAINWTILNNYIAISNQLLVSATAGIWIYNDLAIYDNTNTGTNITDNQILVYPGATLPYGILTEGNYCKKNIIKGNRIAANNFDCYLNGAGPQNSIVTGNIFKNNGIYIFGSAASCTYSDNIGILISANSSIKQSHGNATQYFNISTPTIGKIGDIVWNENPLSNNIAGWVCTATGNPATWATFGNINNRFSQAIINNAVNTGESLQVTGDGIFKTGNLELSDLTKGIILKSPNGTRWLIKVNDSGVLTTTAQ